MTPPPVGTTTGPESPPTPAGPIRRARDPCAVRRRRRSRRNRRTGGRDSRTERTDPPGRRPGHGARQGPVRPGEPRAAAPPRPGRPDVGPDRPPASRRWLAGVATVAAGIQAPVHPRRVPPAPPCPPSGRYDTVQARLAGPGPWFVDPYRAASAAHLLVPTAAHPPAPHAAAGGIADVASATGTTAHMIFLAILFVASVVLAGVTVRDLVGDRAGILAALVFATFPLFWVNPATVGPETTVIVVTTLLLFAAVGSGPAPPRPTPPWSGWPSGCAP